MVTDSSSSLIYIDVLERVTDQCVVLSNIDAHDYTDILTSKDLYLLESKKTGIE